jgi:hypothetical protein
MSAATRAPATRKAAAAIPNPVSPSRLKLTTIMGSVLNLNIVWIVKSLWAVRSGIVWFLVIIPHKGVNQDPRISWTPRFF